MPRRAAETATRAEVQSSVLRRPTAESAPHSVIHAESHSPMWSEATREKEPSVHDPSRSASREAPTPTGRT